MLRLRVVVAFLIGIWLNVTLCEMQLTETASVSRVSSSCRNPPLCDLSDMYKIEPSGASSLRFYSNSQAHAASPYQLVSRRSYYSNFDSPAHYHTFDPISVLASLAFLAFLLQSFASLYDRSRSILPTIVSGRQQSSDMDLAIPEISGRVSRALRDYGSLHENLDAGE